METQQLGVILRPKNFDEMIGQEDVVSTIRTKLAKGEVDRAYMLVGPAGTGKTTLAKIIAREAQGWEFDAGAEPDVIDLNAANHRKIEDIRQLVDQTQTFPFNGKYRVIILDEAQQITKEAQNLLLKPFEEKDSPNVWIICTTDPQKIIPALQTRCSKHQLTRLSKKAVHQLLERAAAYLERTEPFDDFEQEVIRRGSSLGPRAILNAFANYQNGTPAKDAVMAQTAEAGPEFFAIAQAVVYGDWDKPATVWGKQVEGAKAQLKALEDLLKKKAAKEKETDAEFKEEGDPDMDDLASRPEVSRTLRNIVGALLKNEVLKGSMNAAIALQHLSTAVSPNEFDVPLEYPLTIGALFRINKRMRTKE